MSITRTPLHFLAPHLLPLVLLIAGRTVLAYTVFEPECTQPKEPVNFVSTPHSRGTLEILWSSLFTIFACTWTIQHPNVPEQRDGRYPGWKGDVRWGLYRTFQSLKLAVATILAPEIVIFIAWYDLATARAICRELDRFVREDGVPWSPAHGHYAVMGGFVLRVKKKDDSGPGRPYHLTGPDLVYLRGAGHLDRLPHITLEELGDKSKSDPVLKALALGQIVWSVAQIVVRALHHLSISLLELSVFAFAACAVVVYVLYWNKPKQVNTATTVHVYQDEIPAAVLHRFQPASSIVWRTFIGSSAHRRATKFRGQPIGTLSYSEHYESRSTTLMLLLLGTVLFGGIHVAGWNFSFPTPQERILWRCASVYTTAVFLLVLLAEIVEHYVLECLGVQVLEGIRGFDYISTSILVVIYILARLVILVETFRTLGYLPSDAFVSTSVASIPHFS
ncbi:hypothetical protein QBC47DRAFT_186084 [Echria macrotheca]|uniref:Uncharacterized protein n=1 Tax=Echria macrotheca TaxID=438768 RepID=A0AAJ0F645_9PEZI|nr:hypothetical protein QBC47DRAFT_186084 [Echria macrotheca]